MPVFRITSPDGTVYRVTAPEGATEQEALSKVQAQVAEKPKPETYDPTGSFGENLLAGAGKVFADVGRRAKQVASKVGLGNEREVQAEIDDARKREEPLMRTVGGVAGNVLGGLTLAAPTMLIPGAASYPGAMITGAVMGAGQPTATGESTIKNMGIGAAAGAAGKFAGDAIGSALSSKLSGQTSKLATSEAQNAERDAVLQASRKAGYVVPPSSVNPSASNSLLEGLSGKIKTAQVASERNQQVTNDLARKALGMAPDEPLTEGALESIRKAAGNAYAAIKSLPQRFQADQQFASDLQTLGRDFSVAAQEFPEIAGNPAIETLKTALNKPDMSPKAAVELIKKLRFDANKNLKAFDDPAKAALGTAQKEAANAIEELIERNLSTSAPNLLPEFRAARELIAKSYSVESALTSGNVAAQKLASQLSKGKPLSGELKTAADFATQFPKAAQLLKEAPGAVSPLDFGLAFATGNPAMMAARPAARSVILSGPYQRGMVNPNYTPNALLSLGSGVMNNALVRASLPAASADSALLYSK